METLEAQLIRHEGLRLRPYRCQAGKLTIGVGRNLDDVGITKDEAMMLLREDLARVTSELYHKLPWFHDLDPTRQNVLINMAFNLGVAGLLKFKQTLAHVQAGEYTQAAEAMLDSIWSRQVGERAKELALQMELGA